MTRASKRSTRMKSNGGSERSSGTTKNQVDIVVAWLERNGSKRTRDGMARYAIPSDKAFGVSVGTMQRHAKQLGRNHELAMALWETGWYEARMIGVEQPVGEEAPSEESRSRLALREYKPQDRPCGDACGFSR